MAVGNLGHQPLAAKRPPVQTRQLRVGSGLVDKDQLLRVKMCLPEPPQSAALGNVRPILLRCVQDFF